MSLGNIGPPAAAAVPLLNDCFQSTTNVNHRFEIAFALCRIDSSQTNALDYLAANLKHHTNVSLAVLAAKRLGELGPAAMPAVPVLIDALNDGYEQVQTEAAAALKKLGVPVKQYLPTLKVDLKSENVLLRFRTAMRVMQFEPGDRDAHLVLLDQANERSTYRYDVVTAFGDAGPAAKDVAPALRELLKSKDARLRIEAAAALKKIEAPESKK
jgi:HEAT repeat protein